MPPTLYHYRMHFSYAGLRRAWTFYSRNDQDAWGYAAAHLAAEYPDAILIDVCRVGG